MEKTRNAVRVFAFKGDKVVCIRYKSHDKDFFDIPGGKIEEGENEIQACIREFKEETGMLIENLSKIGIHEIIYPKQKRKFVINTYIAKVIKGEPQNFEENDSMLIDINNLRKVEKRFATTHLLDEDLISCFDNKNLNMIFTCDDNHKIIDRKIKEVLNNKEKSCQVSN